MVKPNRKYYDLGGVEAIDIIEAVTLRVGSVSDPSVAYLVGSALKYLLRAGEKSDLREDLEKSYTYIGRAVAAMNGQPVWPAPISPPKSELIHALD